MQFIEPRNKKGKCPVCGKETTVRSTRGDSAYCSRVCESNAKRHAERYGGAMAGRQDKPGDVSISTKFES